MKRLAIALGIAGALIVSHASAAPVFTLNGSYAGPIKIKFSNWESFSAPVDPQTGVPLPGSENFGVVKITSIESDDGNNTPLWAPGKNGAEITGVFRDIIVTSVTPIVGGVNIKSTGGLLDLYINPVGAFAAAGGANQGFAGYAPAGCAVGNDCYHGVSDVGAGGLFLKLAWNTGIDGAGITIDGNLDGTTFPGTGDAAGFLDVIGGPYQALFDSNGQITPFGPRDIFDQNDFCPNGAVGCAVPAQGDWALLSEDPVRAAVVPAPGSLVLLGIAVLGLAALRRKIAA